MPASLIQRQKSSAKKEKWSPPGRVLAEISLTLCADGVRCRRVLMRITDENIELHDISAYEILGA